MEKSTTASPASREAESEREAKKEDHGVISAGNDAHERENAREPHATQVRDEKQLKR